MLGDAYDGDEELVAVSRIKTDFFSATLAEDDAIKLLFE